MAVQALIESNEALRASVRSPLLQAVELQRHLPHIQAAPVNALVDTTNKVNRWREATLGVSAFTRQLEQAQLVVDAARINVAPIDWTQFKVPTIPSDAFAWPSSLADAVNAELADTYEPSDLAPLAEQIAALSAAACVWLALRLFVYLYTALALLGETHEPQLDSRIEALAVIIPAIELLLSKARSS